MTFDDLLDVLGTPTQVVDHGRAFRKPSNGGFTAYWDRSYSKEAIPAKHVIVINDGRAKAKAAQYGAHMCHRRTFEAIINPDGSLFVVSMTWNGRFRYIESLSDFPDA